MGIFNVESGDKEVVGRFDIMIMVVVVEEKYLKKSSGRVDMVSRIDLLVKFDEDSLGEDEEMEISEFEEDSCIRLDYYMINMKDEEVSSF